MGTEVHLSSGGGMLEIRFAFISSLLSLFFFSLFGRSLFVQGENP